MAAVVLADEFLEESFFIGAGVAGGDETEVVATKGIDDGPMSSLNQADGEMPHLARILRGKSDDGTLPKDASGSETEAVLGFIAGALGRIPIEIHV